jgi:peptide/nickel transport system substrate-binding protein
MKKKYLKWVGILAILLSFLTGCSSATTTSSTPVMTAPTTTAPKPATTAPAPITTAAAPATTTTAAPAGKTPSGTLNYVMASGVEETFLPWNGGVIRLTYFRGLIYDTLVYKNAKAELVPELATAWDRTTDGKTWAISLRHGVQFQEGWGELTSEDVKYTFERMAGPGAVMHITSALKQLVASIDTPDKYTVVFHLNAPEANFMGLYGWDIGGIACKKYVESVGDDKANDHPIGTGPYMLAEHKKGAYVKLQTVPDVMTNWRIVPDFQYIIVSFVPEEVTRVSMLKTGEADIIEMNYDSIDAIAGNSNLEARPTSELLPSTDVFRFGGLDKLRNGFYDPTNPWADQKVRQALNYAINKDEMAKQLYHGFGQPAACESGILEWMNMAPYPYDPAKAKSLLADAGYPNGFKVTLITDERYLNPLNAQLVAGYWKAIGVQAEVVQQDWASLRQAWSQGKLNKNIWTHRTPQITGDPRLQLSMALLPDTVLPSFADDKTEALRSAIATELDLNKMSSLITQLGQYLHDQAAWVFLVWSYPVMGVNKRLGKWDTIGLNSNLEYAVRAK